MKKSIADENAQKESNLKELNDQGRKNYEDLEKEHKGSVARLKKEIETLENNLAQIKLKNKGEEHKMREDYKKSDR